MVLCVRQDRDAGKLTRTWVVNTGTGALSFDGATDLRLPPSDNHPVLRQVGNYAAVTTLGEGIHGVGANGELTWFVAGSGQLNQSAGWNRDVAPQTLAVQSGIGTPGGDAVISVADGAIVTPLVPAAERGGQAVVYPNGFAVEYRREASSSTHVVFYDVRGKPLSRPDAGQTLQVGSLDVPMVETMLNNIVYTLAGRKLVELPKPLRIPHARLIDTKLFVTADEAQRTWQEYDLRSGGRGPNCDIDNLGFGYIGSDGAVAVTNGPGTPAQGIDLSNCATLWSLPGSTASTSTEVWRVSTTLIQRTNDELYSLVAPK